MTEKTDAIKKSRQHDEKVFNTGEAIFSQDDLRELINVIYSGYQYRASQFAKLAKLIDFLASESNRFIQPELTDQCSRLSPYLDNFCDFLKANFHGGQQIEDGDTIFLFNTEETSSETEAFLIEFQMISLDIEKAYRSYRTAMTKHLQA